MTVYLNIFSPGQRIDDDNGDPVASGTLEFYDAGTSTPRTVYSDKTLSTSLGTTVSLNSAGYPVTSGNARTLVYPGLTAFKVIAKDSGGSTLWTHDNVLCAVEIATASETSLPETPVVSKTAAYSIVDADQGKVINANSTGGSFVLTLPSAVTVGDGWRVAVRHTGTSNVVTIRTTSSQTIDIPGKQVTSFALKGRGQSVWLVSDGANWHEDGSTPALMQDGLPFIKITDRLTAPPTSPTGGNRYIANGTPTGAWATLSFSENQIIEADGNGSWFAYTPADGWLAYVEDEALYTYFDGSAWTDMSNVTAPSTSALKIAIWADEKATNTSGGTTVDDTWTTHALQTERVNTITGASLATNQFTLPTGKYKIDCQISAYAMTESQIRLYSITNSTVKATSVQVYTANYTSGTGPASILSGAPLVLTAYVNVTAATEVFALQYYTTVGGVASSLGRVRNIGSETEVYAVVTVLDLTSIQGPQGEQGDPGNGILTGWVHMYRTSNAGANPATDPATWVVYAPDGTAVSTTGTTTQGVQEALNYIAANGYNLFINGGGGINTSDVDVATIHCTSGIDFPPMFKQAVVARGITFNFGGTATYGFKFDSMMMSMVDLRSCQVVCGTATYDTAVWLRPRTANAVDPAIAITASDLLFGSIVHGKASSVGLLIDPDDGPIIDGNFIEVHEPNGTGTGGADQGGYGVRILDDATNPVSGNTFRILDSHGHGTASVAVGSSTTNGAMVNSNVLDIHCDPDTGAIGLDLYGTDNVISLRVNNNEGTPATGLNIRTSGLRNIINAGILEATTPIADASAGFTNLIQYAGVRYGGSFYIGTLSSISTVDRSGSAVASRLQFHSTGADSAVTTWRWSNDTSGASVIMSKSRGAAVGTQTVVASGDTLGEIIAAGSDGTDMEPAASIRFEVDGTPGAGDMPGRIVFSTTADGAETVTDRFIINSAGKFLAGVASAKTMANGGSVNPTFQLFAAAAAASFGVVRETTPGVGGAIFALGSSRSTPSTGSNSALQSGDGIGSLLGVGDTGSNLHAAGASIVMAADGNWSGTDAPGRITFGTTPTGSLGAAVERMRIDSNGNVVVNTAAISTSAANGFLYVPSCAGTPSGTPTSFTGRVPIVVDTTNNKLYFYSGGAWRDAGP